MSTLTDLDYTRLNAKNLRARLKAAQAYHLALKRDSADAHAVASTCWSAYYALPNDPPPYKQPEYPRAVRASRRRDWLVRHVNAAHAEVLALLAANALLYKDRGLYAAFTPKTRKIAIPKEATMKHVAYFLHVHMDERTGAAKLAHDTRVAQLIAAYERQIDAFNAEAAANAQAWARAAFTRSSQRFIHAARIQKRHAELAEARAGR